MLVFHFPGKIRDVPPFGIKENKSSTAPLLWDVRQAFMAFYKSINYVILWTCSGII